MRSPSYEREDLHTQKHVGLVLKGRQRYLTNFNPVSQFRRIDRQTEIDSNDCLAVERQSASTAATINGGNHSQLRAVSKDYETQ